MTNSVISGAEAEILKEYRNFLKRHLIYEITYKDDRGAVTSPILAPLKELNRSLNLTKALVQGKPKVMQERPVLGVYHQLHARYLLQLSE
jgi:hypothetical protein